MGLLEFEFLIIENLSIGRIPHLASQVGSMAPADGLVLRASFFDTSIDTASCPVTYSREKHITTYDKTFDSEINLNWVDIELPNLVTAYNSLELAS